jgi:hypothetical protein
MEGLERKQPTSEAMATIALYPEAAKKEARMGGLM